MPKSKRRKPKNRRPPHRGDRPRILGVAEAVGEPQLITDVRETLAAADPLDLLALASTLLGIVDPRSANPFEHARRGSEVEHRREEIFESFIEVDCLETTALLATIAELSPDEVLRARIRREISRRRHPLPDWLQGIGGAVAYRTAELTHVLHDGDNVIVGVRFPDGFELTVVVYVDHNLGTLVKDAFVVPEPAAGLIEDMRTRAHDPDVTCQNIDPADARARIAEAIDTASITFPPFESDTWPACRALVEWTSRMLPSGGTGYKRPEWSEDELDELADRFFESTHGKAFRGESHRRRLSYMLSFATHYGPGDPMRWSPTAVELFLLDWMPRKVLDNQGSLAKVPRILRSFVGFCGEERGIRPRLIDDAVGAVDRFEPEYKEAIRGPRPAGIFEAITDELGFNPFTRELFDEAGASGDIHGLSDTDFDGEFDDDFDDEHWSMGMLRVLAGEIGGLDALDELDTSPLPDEEFDWTDIPGDIRGEVEGVLQVVDRLCGEHFDVEFRTSCRRFLALVATGDPEVFRRNARWDTTAASVCWAMGKANGFFEPPLGTMTVKEFGAHCGVSNPSQRGRTLLTAAGMAGTFTTLYQVRTGRPDLLVSARRRHLADRRDLYRQTLD